MYIKEALPSCSTYRHICGDGVASLGPSEGQNLVGMPASAQTVRVIWLSWFIVKQYLCEQFWGVDAVQTSACCNSTLYEKQ